MSPRARDLGGMTATCTLHPELPVLPMDEDRLRLARAYMAGEVKDGGPKRPEPSHRHLDPDRRSDLACWGTLRFDAKGGR